MTGEIAEMYVIYDIRATTRMSLWFVWAVAGDLIIANQVLGRAQRLKEARSLLPYGLIDRGPPWQRRSGNRRGVDLI
jgi:hypothetical protein